MSYVHMGVGDHYFSNGVDSGRITSGVYYPVGLPTPVSPTLTAVGGSLLKGWYQVGVAYTNTTTGEEGGISASGNLELTSAGGLRVPLPGATTGATHVNIYLSDSNGTVPRLHSTVTAATTTIDLTVLSTGRPSAGRFEEPLPAGTLFAHNGRLCSFAGSTVYIGLPYRHGYYLPVEGYIPFQFPVDIAISNQEGTYVVAGKTYYIPGDLGDVQDKIREVLPYDAVPGTAFVVPNKPLVGWFSDKGIVIADTSGGVDTSMADKVIVTPPQLGVSNTFECSSYRTVVSCGYAMNLDTKAVTSYSGFDFTSLSYLYGTKVDGIYFTNTTGTANASVGFGHIDFGSEQFKHLPAVYLGLTSASVMNLQVQTPAGQNFTYAARNYSTDLREQRVDPGKGLRASWFELTLSNTAGGTFSLASVSFAPVTTSRRI